MCAGGAWWEMHATQLEPKTKKSGGFLGAQPTVEPTGIRC